MRYVRCRACWSEEWLDGRKCCKVCGTDLGLEADDGLGFDPEWNTDEVNQ